MPGQQYNPLSFFMVLGLLALAPPETINKQLESISFALHATSQTMESLKKGMDTFHTGLQQLYHPGTGEGDFKENDFGTEVKKAHHAGASVMPVNAPGWNHKNKEEEKTEQNLRDQGVAENNPGIENDQSNISIPDNEKIDVEDS